MGVCGQNVLFFGYFCYALHGSRWTLGVPMQSMRMSQTFTKIAEFILFLTQGKVNMFDLQHLQGASSDLVQLMFKIGQKAAELERVKLQSEIQKEQSKLR